MGRRMNEKLFNEVKEAIRRGGASAEEISKVFGIGVSTYYRVSCKNTWEDYSKEKSRRISRMMENKEAKEKEQEVKEKDNKTIDDEKSVEMAILGTLMTIVEIMMAIADDLGVKETTINKMEKLHMEDMNRAYQKTSNMISAKDQNFNYWINKAKQLKNMYQAWNIRPRLKEGGE